MNKYKVLLLILIGSLSGCKKDDLSNVIELPQVEQFLRVYQNNTIFHFVNSDSDTIEIISHYSKEDVSKELPDGNSFVIEDFIVLLNSEYDNLNFLISGSAFVSPDREIINPSLNIGLMPFNINSIWIDIRVSEMFATSVDETNFHNDIQILNKMFSNVYSVIASDQNSFSELYFNKEYGVLAFKDSNNTLWRIDKIK
jgi:hypothetical protein